jgi:hypothetical protein
LADIPFGIAEGDVLIGDTADGTVIITGKDDAAKAERAERIAALFNKLKNKNRSDK